MFPVPTLATGGHSVELALSTLFNIQCVARTHTRTHTLSHSVVSWMAASKKICPKTCPCPDHRNLCVSFFAKEIFADEFSDAIIWDEISLDYTGPLTCAIPRGRCEGVWDKLKRRGEWSNRAASRGHLKPPDAGRQGSTVSPAPSKKTVLIWTLAFKTVSINFCCFKALMCGNLLWQPEEIRSDIYIHTHMHRSIHTCVWTHTNFAASN